MAQGELAAVLRAAAILLDTSSPSDSSRSQLRQRLLAYHQLVHPANVPDIPHDIHQVQHQAGCAALDLINDLHRTLLHLPIPPDNKPFLGTRDLSFVRTLLAIVFEWSINPLLDRLTSFWSSSTSHIIDLTDDLGDQHLFFVQTETLLHLTSPPSTISPLTNVISPILIDKHLPDVLRPAITIGWLPHQYIDPPSTDYASLRASVMHLLQLLTPAITISAMGNILARRGNPPHLNKSLSFLLSKQLIRPNGISGLFASVFGELGNEHDESAPLVKLEQIAQLMKRPGPGMKAQEYFALIIPRCLAFLASPLSASDSSSKTLYIRAAAFSLSRFLMSDGNVPIAARTLLSILHHPFQDKSSATIPPSVMSVFEALQAMTAFISNTDPSPLLISSLFSPIISRIYTLMERQYSIRVVDHEHGQLIRGSFITWGKIVDLEEGREVLWSIIQGAGGSWQMNDAGGLEWQEDRESMSLLPSLPSSTDVDTKNPFALCPSPEIFVGLLNSLERTDLTLEIFVRLLTAYLEVMKDKDNDPTKSLLYIQLILQIQLQILDTERGKAVLVDPSRILEFVDHVLDVEYPDQNISEPRSSGSGLRLDDLKIVEEKANEDSMLAQYADSDDEDMGGLETSGLDSDITPTAITLLLSVLESHPTISTVNSPMLDVIWNKLERPLRGNSNGIRSLAREARLVMAGRLGLPEQLDGSKAQERKRTEAQQKYQKALKLLTDPILPVKAHGLTLLRELVSPNGSKLNLEGKQVPDSASVEEALLPAILDIFLQFIQEDDSYIFLNAVQGLAAMVDGFGRNTLQNIVDIFSKGLLKSPIEHLSKKEIDVRLRVGEAMAQVIRRAGEFLSVYSDVIVSPLLQLIRQSDAPIVLRISSLSLLGHCAETNHLALAPYVFDIVPGITDLLQVESIIPKDELKSLDEDHSTIISKRAEFRRAALHFLTLLNKSLVDDRNNRLQTDSLNHGSTLKFPSGSWGSSLQKSKGLYDPNVLERLRLTAQYLVNTDSDSVVRIMARELLDGLGTN